VPDGIGVENLKGSGLIAGVTSRAYQDTFTLSYATGRSVGIGAYLMRLGQRVVQMRRGPMILTGFQALNKLLGKNVYTSQDQLGGPQIMAPNGITHAVVDDDYEGAKVMLNWLSYVPENAKTASPLSGVVEPADPVDRPVGAAPPADGTAYDVREILDNAELGGLFDAGSFTETLPDWGKTVIAGRAKLGGIPFGVIAVETRSTEVVQPADPANPLSREAVSSQAGQVWYPDSAYKTATAIRDFDRGKEQY
jgi:acetyl-CoA carboxylase/biotin carboxylase 1